MDSLIAEHFMADTVRAIERTTAAKAFAPPAAVPSVDAALAALYGAVMAAVFTSTK